MKLDRFSRPSKPPSPMSFPLTLGPKFSPGTHWWVRLQPPWVQFAAEPSVIFCRGAQLQGCRRSPCGSGSLAGYSVPAPHCSGGSASASGKTRSRREARDIPWNSPISPNCNEIVRSFRPRFVRRRVRGPELRRILVLSSIWRESSNSRSDFLLGQSVCRNFRAVRVSTGLAHRARSNDGGNPFAFEHTACLGATNAQSRARDCTPFAALQY